MAEMRIQSNGSDGRSRILFRVYVGVLFPGQLSTFVAGSVEQPVFLSLVRTASNHLVPLNTSGFPLRRSAH